MVKSKEVSSQPPFFSCRPLVHLIHEELHQVYGKREYNGGVLLLDCIISVGRPVPSDLPAYAGMVPSDAPADFSQRKIGKHQMTDDIALFSGKRW
jgi:hypothetical protein